VIVEHDPTAAEQNGNGHVPIATLVPPQKALDPR
jgi:hypothetical protein